MATLKTLKPRVATLSTNRVKELQGTGWRTGKTSSAQRGYGYKWQKYREGYLRYNPLCVMCQKEGRVTVATVLDHIQPHRGDKELFWNTSNHQGLCTYHHSSVKQKAEMKE